MQVLVVICKGQSVFLSSQSWPVKADVGVGIHIWDVGHPGTICGAFLCTAGAYRFYIVTDVHVSERSTYASPFAKGIAYGYVVAFGKHFAMVFICGAIFSTTQVFNGSLDIVFCVAVDKPTFHIEGVLSDLLCIADIQIDIVQFSGLRPISPISKSSSPNISSFVGRR